MTKEEKKNKKESEIISVEYNELMSELTKQYVFKITDIDRMVLSRALGDSWDKVLKGMKDTILDRVDDDSISKLGKIELGRNDRFIKLRLEINSLKNNKNFNTLVENKKIKYKLLDSSIEIARISEKLISIIEGESQGKKWVRLIKTEIEGGKIVKTEFMSKVDNYPTISEQVRAVNQLHKFNFLDEKEKVKYEVESAKLSAEDSSTIEQMEEIMRKAADSSKKEVVEAIISEDDYDYDKLVGNDDNEDNELKEEIILGDM